MSDQPIGNPYGIKDADIRSLSAEYHDLKGRVMVLEKCVSLLEKLPDTVDTMREMLASLKTQMYVTWILLGIILTAIIGMAVEMLKRLPAP